MLNRCIECIFVFVPVTETNDEEDMEFLFISFHFYENVKSCSLNKNLRSKHRKAYTLSINVEILRKERLQPERILY